MGKSSWWAGSWWLVVVDGRVGIGGVGKLVGGGDAWGLVGW